MISPIESAPPVLPQGSEPDVLLRLIPSGVSVVSAPSLGGSDESPSGRLVQGAGEARGLDEGLDEHGRGVVALGPVVGQLPADQREDVRAQVGDRDPGQDEEPRIVDHEGEVLLAQLRRPSPQLRARPGRLRSVALRADPDEEARRAAQWRALQGLAVAQRARPPANPARGPRRRRPAVRQGARDRAGGRTGGGRGVLVPKRSPAAPAALTSCSTSLPGSASRHRRQPSRRPRACNFVTGRLPIASAMTA